MEHLIPWLTLKSVTGIGNLLFHRLLNRFGTPEKVLNAPVSNLVNVTGISSRLASNISRRRTPDWVYREIDRCATRGYHIITRHDVAYPALLQHLPDPPPVLYCYGHIQADACHIAVVGSRKATVYGKASAKQLCRDLVKRGISVVSGMARGVDTAAHLGALEGGGTTIAVLGSGLDKVYPQENLKLFHKIARAGAVLSEFALDTQPKPHHFPQRNRIISGMCLGTVVVEAAKRSGSLITARLASEQGREVFAVPGNIHAANAQGPHSLIKQGAKLVENAEDIIEEVGPHIALNQWPEAATEVHQQGASAAHAMTEREMRLLDAMEPYPVHIDTLSRRCSLEVGPLTAALSQLELKGAIQQEPGKYFIRAPDGLKNE